MAERIGFMIAEPLTLTNVVLAFLDSPVVVHIGTMQEDGRTVKTIAGKEITVDSTGNVQIGKRVVTHKI